MRRLFALLLVLCFAVPAYAYGGRRMIDATSVNTDQVSSAVVVSDQVSAIWCRMDLTAIDVGNVRLRIEACETPGISQCVPSTDVAVGAVVTLGTLMTAIGEDKVSVSEDINSAGQNSDYFDIEVSTLIPPIWWVEVDHQSASTASYTVDCWWR